jgi:hypothetical protein
MMPSMPGSGTGVPPEEVLPPVEVLPPEEVLPPDVVEVELPPEVDEVVDEPPEVDEVVEVLEPPEVDEVLEPPEVDDVDVDEPPLVELDVLEVLLQGQGLGLGFHFDQVALAGDATVRLPSRIAESNMERFMMTSPSSRSGYIHRVL